MNKEQTDITTGKQIRHLRTQSGMTQEELAGELNVTRQALSNWERDVNEPDINTLKKICFLFGDIMIITHPHPKSKHEINLSIITILIS